MAVCDLTRIRKRVISLLMADPRSGRYSDAVGDQKRYAVKQEITDAIIESDMQRCAVILATAGHPYRSAFMMPSGNLATGDMLPAHVGGHGKVQIDPTGGGIFKGARLAQSLDHLLEVLHHPTLYPNSKRWYWIEDSVIEHTGSAAKVWIPSFTKNDSACQAHELYTSGVMAGAIALLRKPGGDPGFYNDFEQMTMIGDGMIANGAKVLPDIEELRVMMRERRAA